MNEYTEVYAFLPLVPITLIALFITLISCLVVYPAWRIYRARKIQQWAADHLKIYRYLKSRGYNLREIRIGK